ncbi:PH-like domain-containing protein [Cellulomonas fengjieae]|uniref:PH-like domain-containing protein n=1 Tax=Cellulomonas fengjieae TaxID=2819978 RepID=UPI0027DC5DBD|nr:hypothetical protein [Cellulomonas fengjieae]
MIRQLASTVVLLLVVLAVFWAMRAGWRARTQKSTALVPRLPVRPVELGALRAGPVEAVYVSTTRAGDWLDRVTAEGLGVRSPAQVSVHDAGVLITRQGAPDLFVPAAALRGAAAAPGMAGKVVGGDGLVVLTWQADPQDPRGLDTGLRPRRAADRTRLFDALTTLTTGQAPAQEENS